MSWAQRGAVVLLVGLGGLLVMGRLGDSKKAGASPGKSPIKGATFASAVPVYPGAKLRDEMGGNYYGDLGGPVTFTSHSWFFAISDPVATVAEFYRQNLPPGTKPAEVAEGEVGFEWTPPGALEGESVSVTVRTGELQIGETLKASRTP